MFRWFWRGFPPKPSVGGLVAIIFPDRGPCMKHKWQGWKHLRLFFGRVNPGVLQIRNISQILLWKKNVTYRFCQQYAPISKFHDFVVSSIVGKQTSTVANPQANGVQSAKSKCVGCRYGMGCKLRILQSCLEIVQVKVILVVFFWVNVNFLGEFAVKSQMFA